VPEKNISEISFGIKIGNTAQLGPNLSMTCKGWCSTDYRAPTLVPYWSHIYPLVPYCFR